MGDSLFYKNKNDNLDPCFNPCEWNVSSPCFNVCGTKTRKRNSDIDNLDMYNKINRMREDMDQSIKIHKLRKECKELIKSRPQKKSPYPRKKWSTGVKGLIK